jgi:hypothetical protein
MPKIIRLWHWKMMDVRSTSPRTILEEAAASLTQYKTLLATVSHSLSGEVQAPVRSPNDILLVDDLDMTTDPAGNVRFIDLIEAEVRKSGCSPQGLADRLRHDGIVVQGRTYLPMEWRELPAARVQRRLMKAVADYLGYQGRHAKSNLSRPQTAVEHVATITLDHPSLRHLLFHKVVELVRRSRPYALFERIAGAAPVVLAYLFCHPKHRLLLQQLLLAQCNVTNRSQGDGELQRGYQLRTPYVATLVQYTLAAPGGSQRDLPGRPGRPRIRSNKSSLWTRRASAKRLCAAERMAGRSCVRSNACWADESQCLGDVFRGNSRLRAIQNQCRGRDMARRRAAHAWSLATSWTFQRWESRLMTSRRSAKRR